MANDERQSKNPGGYCRTPLDGVLAWTPGHYETLKLPPKARITGLTKAEIEERKKNPISR